MTDHSESEFTYRMSADEPVCSAVVKAVASVSGTDPAPEGATAPAAEQSLEPLYTVVDPDALEAVLRPARTGAANTKCRVTFRYHDHTVTVHTDGRIRVQQPEAVTPETAD